MTQKNLLSWPDTYSYGMGALLSHQQENGQERPTAYASCSLAPAEKQYSQIEKEELTVVFRMKKFHQYLFGRLFYLTTNHYKDCSKRPAVSQPCFCLDSTLGSYSLPTITRSNIKQDQIIVMQISSNHTRNSCQSA